MAVYRIGVDIGGTFTDFALVRRGDGRASRRTSSSPRRDDPAQAVLDGRARPARRPPASPIADVSIDRPRHDARHQRGDRAQGRADRHAGHARAFATCSTSRGSGATTCSICAPISRRRWCRAPAASRSTSASATTAQYDPAARPGRRSSAALDALDRATTGSRRSRSASCIPMPTRRTSERCATWLARALPRAVASRPPPTSFRSRASTSAGRPPASMPTCSRWSTAISAGSRRASPSVGFRGRLS